MCMMKPALCLLFLASSTPELVPHSVGVTRVEDLTISGDRWAVLISIDDNLGETSDLEGPANDMDALATLLIEKYSFKNKQVLRLEGPHATKKGMLYTPLLSLEDRAAIDLS